MKPRQPRHQPRQKPRHKLLIYMINHANHAKNATRRRARTRHVRADGLHCVRRYSRVYAYSVVGVVGVVIYEKYRVFWILGVVSGVVFRPRGVVFRQNDSEIATFRRFSSDFCSDRPLAGVSEVA